MELEAREKTMKIQLVSVCLVAATLTLAAAAPRTEEELELDYKSDPTNKASVSNFFYKTESLLKQEEKDNARDKRLLSSQDFALGVDFGKKIIRSIFGRVGNLGNLSFLSLRNVFSQIDKRQLMVLESTSTVVLGKS